jgi:hypothetical protein
LPAVRKANVIGSGGFEAAGSGARRGGRAVAPAGLRVRVLAAAFFRAVAALRFTVGAGRAAGFEPAAETAR